MCMYPGACPNKKNYKYTSGLKKFKSFVRNLMTGNDRIRHLALLNMVKTLAKDLDLDQLFCGKYPRKLMLQ